jgi:hypothetical protein
MSMSAATAHPRLPSNLALLARKENTPVLRSSLKSLCWTTFGLATALLATHSIAGDRLFHRRQTTVTVPVQVGSVPAVQVVQLSPSYVPVVQVPVAQTTTTTTVQVPVLSIKLEAPTPQAGVSAPQGPSPMPPVLLPAAAVPVPLYFIPKPHQSLFKRHKVRTGD